MGKGDGEARQPSNPALTFHRRNKSAGLDQQLWRNKLPGLCLEEKVANPLTYAYGWDYFYSSTAGADITIKSNTQWLLVLNKY